MVQGLGVYGFKGFLMVATEGSGGYVQELFRPLGSTAYSRKIQSLARFGILFVGFGCLGVKILSSSTTGPKSVQIYIEKEKDLTYKAKKFSRSPIGITISMLLGLSGKV